MTHIVLTGASGRCVDIDAEDSDLRATTAAAKRLWTATNDDPVAKLGAPLGFTGERRWSAHQESTRRFNPVADAGEPPCE